MLHLPLQAGQPRPVVLQLLLQHLDLSISPLNLSLVVVLLVLVLVLLLLASVLLLCWRGVLCLLCRCAC